MRPAASRLSDALADGDRIHAVIRGVAINQDGASGGLTVPSGPSQAAAIRGALADGAVDPADLAYVEAHGTGTSLGDPIEMRALHAVYDAHTRERPLYVGSVKSNIGHLEAGAGIAGLLKVVLALEHRVIPPSLHFVTPNPTSRGTRSRSKCRRAACRGRDGRARAGGRALELRPRRHQRARRPRGGAEGRGARAGADASAGARRCCSCRDATTRRCARRPRAPAAGSTSIKTSRSPTSATSRRSGARTSPSASPFRRTTARACASRCAKPRSDAAAPASCADDGTSAAARDRLRVSGVARGPGVVGGRRRRARALAGAVPRRARALRGQSSIRCSGLRSSRGSASTERRRTTRRSTSPRRSRSSSRSPRRGALSGSRPTSFRAAASASSRPPPTPASCRGRTRSNGRSRSRGAARATTSNCHAGSPRRASRRLVAEFARVRRTPTSARRSRRPRGGCAPPGSPGSRRVAAAGERAAAEASGSRSFHIHMGSAPTETAGASAVNGAPESSERVIPSLQSRAIRRVDFLHAVVRAHVRGALVDWNAVEGRARRDAATLPTYPFQRESFPIAVAPLPTARRAAPRKSRAPFADWLHEPRWIVAKEEKPQEGAAGRWLVVADRAGFGAELAAALAARGATCVVAPAAELRDGPAIAKRLRELGPAPLRGVVHLGGVAVASGDLSAATLSAGAREACEGRCASRRSSRARHCRFAAAARRHARRAGRDRTRSARAAAGDAVGPRPQLRARGAGDLGRPDRPRPRARRQGVGGGARARTSDCVQRRARRAARDRNATSSGSPAAKFPPPPPRRSRCAPTRPTSSREGSAASGWSSPSGSPHAVRAASCCSAGGRPTRRREPVSPRSRRRVAASPPKRATSPTRRRSRARPQKIGADAPLRGVFHSAGVVDDVALERQGWEQFEKVLASKLHGGANLHRLTRGLALDHFVLFSSAAALIGSFGQVNYAAANAWLDALAQARRAQGLPALSVLWGRGPRSGVARATRRSSRACAPRLRRDGDGAGARRARMGDGAAPAGRRDRAGRLAALPRAAAARIAGEPLRRRRGRTTGGASRRAQCRARRRHRRRGTAARRARARLARRPPPPAAPPRRGGRSRGSCASRRSAPSTKSRASSRWE